MRVCPAKVEIAGFADHRAYAQGQAQGGLQALRVAGFEDVIVGALGAVLVGTFVVDQLGLVGLQPAQFQTAFGGIEEGIFLWDDFGPARHSTLRRVHAVRPVVYARFDLDIGGHVTILLRLWKNLLPFFTAG